MVPSVAGGLTREASAAFVTCMQSLHDGFVGEAGGGERRGAVPWCPRVWWMTVLCVNVRKVASTS